MSAVRGIGFLVWPEEIRRKRACQPSGSMYLRPFGGQYGSADRLLILKPPIEKFANSVLSGPPSMSIVPILYTHRTSVYPR